MNGKSLLVILIIFLVVSCRKDNDLKLAEGNYLIFGHYYGECVGEKCIEIFRLEEDQLLEDTTDNYPSHTNFYNGKYIALLQQQFDSTKDLIDYFPPGLLQETATVIGQPDVADGGGLYIEYNFGGVRKFWLLDQIEENVPAEYHAFMDKVNEKIANLE